MKGGTRAVRHRAGPILVAALLWASAPAAADDHPAPYGLDGIYDPDTGVFTLTWEYDTTTYAVDEYRVYIDGEYVESTTTKEYDDDLSDWEGVNKTYQVSAVVDGSEGNKSVPLMVTFLKHGPYICPVIHFQIYEEEPFLAYGVYPQCIPANVENLGGGE